MKNLIFLLLLLQLPLAVSAQKPKKTYDHNKFGNKVILYMTDINIANVCPNDIALQFISGKTGNSLDDLKNKRKADIEQLKKDIKFLNDNNILRILDKVELKITSESPVKTADILLHCHYKENTYILTLTNCIQTNITWVMGDRIIPSGEGIDGLITRNEGKKEKAEKANKLLAKLKEVDEQQKKRAEAGKKHAAHSDSLRRLRSGYQAVLFPMKKRDNSLFSDKSSKYYNHDKTNMPLQGYYVTNAGEKISAVIAYHKPEFLVGDVAAAASLYICKEANGKVVDVFNPDNEPNFEKFIKKDQIQAFFVGGQLYANYPRVGWGIVINEGAIHSYAIILKIKDRNGTYYTAWKGIQKLGDVPAGSIIAPASEKAILYMMNDCPEIVQEYKDGKMTIYEAEIKYNIWYDIKYPGKVKYILGKDYGMKEKTPVLSSAPSNIATQEATAYDKKIIAAANKAHRAPKQDKFAGRPTTADAAIASTKPEVKVKKETFLERIKRIKADGNSVGVLVRCNNLVVNPGNFGEGITKARVMGTYEPLEGIENLANKTVEELNKGFGEDVFETVNYSLIPVKEGKYGKMDNWWSTKYKMIVIYDLSPYYNAYYKTNTSTGQREYKAQMRVDSEVIVMAAEDATQGRLKYVTSSPKTWGTFKSEYFTGPGTTDFDIIQDLKAAINPPADAKIIEELIKSQQEYIDKFVKKKSK